MADNAELQIVISANVVQAQEAMTRISETAQQIGNSMTTAGSESSASMTGITDKVQQVNSTLSTAAETATQARNGLMGVADAESGFIGLEAAVRELTSQMNAMSSAAAKTDMEIASMGADVGKAEGEILSFGESVEKTKRGIEGTRLAMKAFMGIAVAGMIGEWTSSAEKTAISLDKLSSMAHLSGQQAEQLSVMASGAEISLDSLSGMVGRMDARVMSAATGTASLSKVLSELGVNANAFGTSSVADQAQMLSNAMKQAYANTALTETVLKGTGKHAKEVQQVTDAGKQLAAQLKTIGVNAKEFQTAADPQKLQMLQQALQTTTQSGTNMGRALGLAGINMNTFMHAAAPDQIQMVAQAYDKLSKNSKTSALGVGLVTTVFGRQGQQMIPLLQHYNELNDFAKKLKMPVMDSNEITLAAEKTRMLSTAMQMMMNSVLAKLLPIVDSLGTAFYHLASNITHPGQAIKDFVTDLGPLGAAATATVMAFEGMKVFNSITGTIKTFVGTAKSAAVALRILTVVEDKEAGTKSLELAGWIRSTAAIVGNTAVKVATTAATMAMTAATTIATAATTAFGVALDIAMGPVGLIIVGVAALAIGIYELIKHWQAVSDFLGNVWNHIASFAAKVFEGLKNFFAKWGVDILATFVPFIGVPLLIYKHWGQIEGWFHSLWNRVRSFFAKWGPDILAVVAPFIGVPLLISKHWNQITSFFSKLFGEVRHLFTGLVSDSLNFGSNLVHMFGEGIMSKVHEVENAVKGVASKIKSFLGFHSPTEEGPGSEADNWAPSFIDMYVKGLQSGIPKVQSALKRVLEPTAAGFSVGVTGGAATLGAQTAQVLGRTELATGHQFTFNNVFHLHGADLNDPQKLDQLAQRIAFYNQQKALSVGAVAG